MGQTIQDNVTSVKSQRHRQRNMTNAPSQRQTNTSSTPPPNFTKALKTTKICLWRIHLQKYKDEFVSSTNLKMGPRFANIWSYPAMLNLFQIILMKRKRKVNENVQCFFPTFFLKLKKILLQLIFRLVKKILIRKRNSFLVTQSLLPSTFSSLLCKMICFSLSVDNRTMQ